MQRARLQAYEERLRAPVRRAFYRSPAVRRLLRMALAWQPETRGYELSHLPFHPEQDAIGPVQRDEALLLYALTRVLRPAVVLEVGFLGGQSAFNFLRALEPDSHLYSFDIAEGSERIARDAFSRFPNFTFQRLSQDEITPEHVGGQKADLIFLDASHDLELNARTFERLAPMLADGGVFAVHDTGTWHRSHFRPKHHGYAAENPDGWTTPEEYEHRRGEREFVNWVLENHPEFSQLHLHSTRTLRHGTTLMQRRAPLRTGAAGGATATAAAGA